jgi:hypothetical protein
MAHHVLRLPRKKELLLVPYHRQSIPPIEAEMLECT